MERFSYDMDNVYILCRDEDELKRAYEIGTMFGFFPDLYESIDDAVSLQLKRFAEMKEKNKKVTLVFYVNENSMFTSMYVCELENVTNRHKLRSFSWLQRILLEYTY